MSFIHKPPFITTGEVPVRWRARIARLRAVGRIDVRADLDLQMLQRGSIIGLEKIVQNLTSFRLRIIDEEARRCARAHRADAVKNLSAAMAIDNNGWDRRMRRRSFAV